MTAAANGNRNGGVARETANVFTGILLALIITSTLDVFFKNFQNYTSATEFIHAVGLNLGSGTLATLQLLVFLFTVIRFYWGVLRYNEAVSPVEGTPHLFLGLTGAVVLFSTFYVTGLMVRNPSMFYWTLAVANLIDLSWFLILSWFLTGDAWLPRTPQIQKIWRWYVIFDFLTLTALLLLIWFRYVCPRYYHIFNGVALAAVAGIGTWDLHRFWAYYTKADNWEQTIR